MFRGQNIEKGMDWQEARHWGWANKDMHGLFRGLGMEHEHRLVDGGCVREWA